MQSAVTDARRIEAGSFRGQALSLLFGRTDWPQQLVEHLRNTGDDELEALCASVPIPKEVQPRFLPIFAWENGVMVLNHFDRAEFDVLNADGQQTPHYHHFDFATRVLNGSYTHWVFRNSGTLDRPDLGFGAQIRCRAGEGYFIPYYLYHHVFPPEDDTVTLMIRSKRRTGRDPEPQSVEMDRVLALREKLIEVLASCGELGQCFIHDLEPDSVAD